jgi:hypothetical protein
MKHIFLVSMFVLPTMVAAQAGTTAKTPLQGAWQIVEDQNGRVTQPSLYVFTARHFSRMRTLGEKPRPLFKELAPGQPIPAEEKVSDYDTFAANTGSYEISGDTILFKVPLAKRPGRGDDRLHFKLEGDTLTLTNPSNKAFTKLTRLE